MGARPPKRRPDPNQTKARPYPNDFPQPAAYACSMTLDDRPSHPAARSYVLMLHREAMPQTGRVLGRLENMVSGRRYYFGSADELLACLTKDVTSTPTRPQEPL